MPYLTKMSEDPRLPRLAWIALVQSDNKRLDVLHGRDVETGPDWLVEGVWPDAFSKLSFSRSPHFFGSGIDARGDEIRFVPSAATVDRLLIAEFGAATFISNSLPLILGVTGARLNPDVSYGSCSFSIAKGIDGYDPDIPVVHPTLRMIRQHFHDVLVLSGAEFERDRLSEARDFRGYSEYVESLCQVVDGIGRNMSDSGRQKRLHGYGTLSRGYDSPAVAALVRNIGVRHHYSALRSNTAIPRWLNRMASEDDGRPIGEILGVEVEPLRPLTTRHVGQNELYFLAASYAEPETVFHSLAQDLESRADPSVLFTGYQGGLVWGTSLALPYLTDMLKRKDTSGLNISELRLKAGFVNVPVPFIYARSLPSIFGISKSDEMAPWRLGTDYDRPIPRRIVEEAGVPRSMFGMRKKAVIDWYGLPYNRQLRDEFQAWLEEREAISISRVKRALRRDRWLYPVAALAAQLRGKQISDGAAFALSRDVRRLLNVWATNQLADTYAQVGRGWHPPGTRARPEMEMKQ
jgi:hypothetical protein